MKTKNEEKKVYVKYNSTMLILLEIQNDDDSN